ncbi:response regulator [Sedimenticola sp.]|uniref:response regulator n=1 Tax=Sedimenticola sp. TaxID=1940285 RepID=UPI003D0AACB2
MAENTLLLIDDDQPLREYYSLSLQAHHYEVIQADDSKSILDLIEQYDPALIITDLVMPDHDGLEGIFRLIGNFDIPVIVLSAYPEYIQLSRPVVSASYVKPLSAEDLLRAVKKILGPEAQ